MQILKQEVKGQQMLKQDVSGSVAKVEDQGKETRFREYVRRS